MKKILFAALLVAWCKACNPPPEPHPPDPTPSADAGPAPSPAPTPTPSPTVPPAPSDRFDLACANIGRLGCADYDPQTCSKALRVAFEANVSPTTLNSRTIDCLGAAPNKAGIRACGFEKCP